MRAFHRAAAVLVLFASAAYAQQGTYIGKWTGTATASNGSTVRVNVNMTKDGGTLRTSPGSNTVTIDQCHDRDIPITVQSQTATEVVIAIKGASVLKGCIDETATLKMSDANTIQSTLQDGRVVKLTRAK